VTRLDVLNGIVFGGAGIEILVAHLVYFGLRDEPAALLMSARSLSE